MNIFSSFTLQQTSHHHITIDGGDGFGNEGVGAHDKTNDDGNMIMLMDIFYTLDPSSTPTPRLCLNITSSKKSQWGKNGVYVTNMALWSIKGGKLDLVLKSSPHVQAFH